MDKDVFAVEKNIRGAWVIYGALGVRQYYGHTKLQSIAKYRQEYREKILEEKGERDEEMQILWEIHKRTQMGR